MKNPLLMAAATLLALGLAHTGSAQGPQGRGRPPATPTITTLAGDVQADTRYQVTRDGGSHPMWLPDGQALYFDRDHQMFRLAVNAKDMSSRTEPTPLPIKGFAQAEYRRQFDLMSNGRQFLMLSPSSTRAVAPASVCMANF